MNFNSLEFLIFLPAVLLLHRLLPHRFRWVLLLGASYLFYMWWNPKLVVLILTTTAVSYGAALLMEKKPAHKKLWLITTLGVCLGILFFFKYFEFLANSLLMVYNGFTGSGFRLTLNLLLPVGISFYTFQTLSYVIDVYRGEIPAERHFGYYALFVSYFPQLVAGPIESAANLLPQLKEEQPFRWEDLRMGFQLLLSGFFRKCVIADLFGIWVNRIFAAGRDAGPFGVLFGGALFCIQMYCDFAGYSEIAMGSARMMGVRLMKNFDRPYLSASYSEFFRRWHISLNRWFTSYLYIPLGGSRCGKLRRLFNSTLVFLLCGLWHGARWTYVAWGLYAALFVGLEGAFLKPAIRWCDRYGIRLEEGGWLLLRRCLMFLIFIPAAILFRAETIPKALEMIAALFGNYGGYAGLTRAFEVLQMDTEGFLQIVLSLVTMCLLPVLTEERTRSDENAEAHRIASYVCLTVIIGLCWIALLSTEANAAFAYFQF